MAKRAAPSEPPEEEKKYSVAIDPDLVRKLKLIAAADDVSPPTWVNNQLRKLIKEHLPRVRAELGFDE